jgi:hypothetical protein
MPFLSVTSFNDFNGGHQTTNLGVKIRLMMGRGPMIRLEWDGRAWGCRTAVVPEPPKSLGCGCVRAGAALPDEMGCLRDLEMGVNKPK